MKGFSAEKTQEKDHPFQVSLSLPQNLVLLHPTKLNTFGQELAGWEGLPATACNRDSASSPQNAGNFQGGGSHGEMRRMAGAVFPWTFCLFKRNCWEILGQLPGEKSTLLLAEYLSYTELLPR